MNDPLVYSYVIGGVVFVTGLIYAMRQGFIGLHGRGLVRLLVSLGVIGFFFSLQAYLQYAPMKVAPALPTVAVQMMF
ncbi:MAG: hypothetical protein R3F19_11545 [Verrucomicrobiales bacterium]